MPRETDSEMIASGSMETRVAVASAGPVWSAAAISGDWLEIFLILARAAFRAAVPGAGGVAGAELPEFAP